MKRTIKLKFIYFSNPNFNEYGKDSQEISVNPGFLLFCGLSWITRRLRSFNRIINHLF